MITTIDDTKSKKRIAISTLSQIVSQIITAGIAILILKILTTSLGVGDYGIFATIIAFVSTFSLLTDLGLNAVTAREIAKRPDRAEDIISHNMGLRLFLCMVMAPLISVIGLLVYPDASSSLRYGILFMALFLFFDAIRAVALAYFTSKVRNDITATVIASQHLLYLLLVIGATSLGAGLFGYIGAYIVASLVGAISSLLIIHRYLRVRPRANMAKWKTIIGMSLSIGLIQIVNMIYLKVDTVLLSVLDSSAAVGLYGVAYALINTFMTIPSFLMTALIPSMATADEKTIRSMVQKAAQYMIMFACALVVIGYVIRENIVLTVANNDFVGAATPFAILAFATAFSFIYSVFGFASVSLNKHHKIVFVSLVCLVLNVLLNIILIPKYSVAGAAWATVVSEVIALTSVYIIFGRETGIRIDLLSPAIKPVLAAVALLPLSYLFHFVWDTSSAFFNTLAIGAILGGSYLAILFIIRGLPSEIDGLLRKYLLRA